MIQGIDHIVILVEDLAAAVADYGALGFTVIPGGEHTDGATENALIVFADGTYLELLAFKREAPDHRWWPHVDLGEGLIDWALLPSDMAADLEYVRSAGVAYQGPVAGGRMRTDGEELRWEFGLPPKLSLPFLCGDVTPRSLRVPEGGTVRNHANGVIGIAAVVVAVENLAKQLPIYQTLFPGSVFSQMVLTGFELPAAEGQLQFLSAGDHTGILLAEPAPEHLTRSTQAALLHERLDTRGEGICVLVLRVDNPSKVHQPDRARTHGVPLLLVAD